MMDNKVHKSNRWKLIAIILFIYIALSFLLKKVGENISKNPVVSDVYISKVETGGDIEKMYLTMGPYDTAYAESATMSSLKKIEIFYPSAIDSMEKVPVVIFLNGTGTPASKYQALQKHMASWGFITIGNEEDNSFYGEAAELSIRYLELANSYDDEKTSNPLKGHIDFDNIGITGHSQGGVGVINGITLHPHSDMIKAAVILSSTVSDAAKALLWDPDPSKIHADTLMIVSAGDALAPVENMKTQFDMINGQDKVMAVRNDTDHGGNLYHSDGYVTAWFMYYLKNDQRALNAFYGDSEISNNRLYENVQIEQAK
jgi:dienelactone hydrolase